ncbi:MAG: hypothetical protein AAF968_05275 [Pseudomonadota bacterium]
MTVPSDRETRRARLEDLRARSRALIDADRRRAMAILEAYREEHDHLEKDFDHHRARRTASVVERMEIAAGRDDRSVTDRLFGRNKIDKDEIRAAAEAHVQDSYAHRIAFVEQAEIRELDDLLSVVEARRRLVPDKPPTPELKPSWGRGPDGTAPPLHPKPPGPKRS